MSNIYVPGRRLLYKEVQTTVIFFARFSTFLHYDFVPCFYSLYTAITILIKHYFKYLPFPDTCVALYSPCFLFAFVASPLTGLLPTGKLYLTRHV